MALVRIVIATPSAIEQCRLARLLSAHAEFEIIVCVDDLSAAYSAIEATMPNVVLVSSVFAETAEYACMLSLFRAVEAAPILIGRAMLQEVGADFKAAVMSGAVTTQMTSLEIRQVIYAALLSKPKSPALAVPKLPVATDKILLLGASTGGIDALTTILSAFPANCPPTAIVQHTGRAFSETLVRLLNNRCAAEVVMAQTGVAMQAGRICLAGGIDGHLRFEIGAKITCAVHLGPEISGHRPSIDAMFLSALPFAKRAIAVLLTGMGRDGALGLQSLRAAGAQTIGQDQASSVVYGMPRVAYEIGAVETQLGLERIGPELMQRCSPAPPRLRSMTR
jgi:two-component system, chemotaxis family, protein-glutamate methylesterase/glutaminase